MSECRSTFQVASVPRRTFGSFQPVTCADGPLPRIRQARILHQPECASTRFPITGGEPDAIAWRLMYQTATSYFQRKQSLY
ncbi:hypothetical protein Pla52n_04800 [Stieleria varia]|uniref:Uncharacterized protein n=1 Tax=Stieleria varia TaxID=2528005 RepID=A0A5C6B789_9BACT|nr:hypothetical protein Pla52n_04800 [Stieleria varia]